MRKVLASLFIVCFTITSIQAQQHNRSENRELRKEFNESLSADQKSQLEAQKTLRKEHRQALEATYSGEQKAILANEDLSRKGKQKALQPTFSETQKTLKKSQKEAMKAAKEKFEVSLNAEQLVKYKELDKRGRKKGAGSKKGKKQ